MTTEAERKEELNPVGCSAGWVCDQGDGTFDHDWEEKSDSSGEIDGGSGDDWKWSECRACGITEYIH